MRQTWLKRAGWMVVVLAALLGFFTIPVLNSHGSVQDGSVQVQAGPLGMRASGTGTFQMETAWGISWLALGTCTAALAVGAGLIRTGRRGSEPCLSSS